ncbi:MAG: 50S ribosomal protein L18 [Chitinophagales bacterium]|nr:50S ribosomal protein L18 [Chitinophagales bacterium]
MSVRKEARREKIRRRIRKSLTGTKERPRLSVFRSNRDIYAQIIDDVNGHTLIAASSRVVKSETGNKVDASKEVGRTLARQAVDAGIISVVFDRGGYLYHGRVKALADGAREGGLKF